MFLNTSIARRTLLLFFAVVVVLCPLRASEESVLKVDVTSAPMLCGLHSLFSGIYFLDSSSQQNYDEMFSSFPEIKTKGSSLADLKRYVDTKTKFHTAIRFCTDAELAAMQDTVALVLIETKPIAHIYLKRPVETGIQLFDFPHNHKNLKPSEFDTEKRPTLLISTKPIPEENTLLIVLSALFILFAIATMVSLLRKDRNNPKNSICVCGENANGVPYNSPGLPEQSDGYPGDPSPQITTPTGLPIETQGKQCASEEPLREFEIAPRPPKQ